MNQKVLECIRCLADAAVLVERKNGHAHPFRKPERAGRFSFDRDLFYRCVALAVKGFYHDFVVSFNKLREMAEKNVFAFAAQDRDAVD